jgi:ArsR family transcriptional regulator, virulence genes transcriptional regulator
MKEPTCTQPTTSNLPQDAMTRERAARAAAMLRALGNPNRLMVLCSLVEGEQSVGALNQKVPLSQSALSQHLARLREEDLVATRRESQTIYYRIADPVVFELIETLYGRYCAPVEGLGENGRRKTAKDSGAKGRRWE